jgi:hypothetical protein
MPSFLSDLWNGAKQTVSDLSYTAGNWLKGAFTAPGGYRYCGPGNSLDAGDPINASDSACRQHDMDYDSFKKQKDKGRLSDKELRDLVRESDDRLISNLQRTTDRNVGSYLSEWGIRGKKTLEDWGLLSPEQFVT